MIRPLARRAAAAAILLALLASIAYAAPSGLPTASERSERCPAMLSQDPPRTLPSLSRIFNGDGASANLLPYLAAIFTFDASTGAWKSPCSGVLLSPRLVLTAALCGATPASRVLLQAASLADFPAAGAGPAPAGVVNVTRARPHPRYEPDTPSSAYDVALLELAADAPTGARAIKVNVDRAAPAPGAFVRALGYGITGRGDTSADLDRGARQVDAPVLEHAACELNFQPIAGVTIDEEIHVCAGYEDTGECVACTGDNGGPVVQYDADGEAVLVGVAGESQVCGSLGLPGLYLRMAFFKGWLDEEIGGQYQKASGVVAVFEQGRSAGVVAGIAVGGVAGAVLLLVGAVVGGRYGRRWWRRREADKAEMAEAQAEMAAAQAEAVGAGEPPGPYVSGEYGWDAGAAGYHGSAWGSGDGWGGQGAGAEVFAGGAQALGIDYSQAGLPPERGGAGRG